MQITIYALQSYLLGHYCGWANEQSLFMKLVEEIGEVAEILNKRAGRKSSDGSVCRMSWGRSWRTCFTI